MKIKLIFLAAVCLFLLASCGGKDEGGIDETDPPQDSISSDIDKGINTADDNGGDTVDLENVVYEAEEGTLISLDVLNDKDGYTGSGFAGIFDKDDSELIFEVTAPEAGSYDLVFSTFSDMGEKFNNIYVNGEFQGELKSPLAQAFEQSVLQRIYLNEGTNTISVKKSWGWCYFDSLQLRFPEKRDTAVYDVSPTLANPNADDNAKRLMKFITDNYGKKVISGQYADSHTSTEFLQIKKLTGKYPAILGLDMMEYSPSRVEYGAKGTSVEAALEWGEMGGIVTYAWHWNAPADLINEAPDKLWWSGFYTRATTFDLAAALADKTGEHYNLLIRDIDVISEQLAVLRDAGIPILWRPLHEASGGWFWWGAAGKDAYIELWKLMFDRMTNHHNLTNLIWYWNGQHDEWYPGGEYVDLIGVDIYAPAHSYSSQQTNFYELIDFFDAYNTKKVLGLSEVGVFPDIDLMFRDNAVWSMVIPWSGEFVVKNGQLSDDYTESSMLKKNYDDERLITFEDLPDIKTYPLDYSNSTLD